MVAWLLIAGLAMTEGQAGPPAPVGPIPSERQLAWQRNETYAFVHFGPNTFTDREWGEGLEDPNLFNPTALDCKQWVKAFKDAGFTAVILTAKHHDGFCLWPSKQSTHTVAQTQWRGGKGDVLRDLSDAVRAAGMKLGVYLSPWDRNHPKYGTPEYNDVFKKCLEEVLTGYGRVDEVWFDGANGEGPNGKRQVYDWPGFIAVVRKFAPHAVIFSDAGPDIRWVGNEAGYAGETNWSTLNRDLFVPGTDKSAQLTEGHENGTHWVPAECDVSIRPGWFYHAAEDGRVKSLAKLLDIYYGSVGRNGALLLNVPPDRRGLIHEIDVARLKEFRRALDVTFKEDLARKAKASASATRGSAFSAARVIDGKPNTYWAAPDGVTAASVTLEWTAPKTVNRVVLAEAIELGQRVKRFTVDARVGGLWRPLGKGTTIGAKRILRTPAVSADAIRVTIEDAKACPTLTTFGLFAAPPEVEIAATAFDFLARTVVSATSDQPGTVVRYTLDGTTPTGASPVMPDRLTLDRSATLKAIGFRDGVPGLWPAEAKFVRHDASALKAAVSGTPGTEPGLRYSAFAQGWQSLSDMASAKPTGGGVCDVPTLDVRPRDEHFALRFDGWLHAPQDGIFAFLMASDDGSRLRIGDALVIDHDGLHGMVGKQGVVGLKAGWHRFSLEYFNAAGGMGLHLTWRGPGVTNRMLERDDLRR